MIIKRCQKTCAQNSFPQNTCGAFGTLPNNNDIVICKNFQFTIDIRQVPHEPPNNFSGGLQGTLFRWGIAGHSFQMGDYRTLFPWNVSQSIEILSAPSPFSKFGRGSTPLPSLQKGDGGLCFCIRNKQKSEIFILGVHL